MAYSLEELLARPKLERPYYWDKFLPVGGRCLIAAEWKSYKSFLTMNVAYDLACGIEPLSGGAPEGDGITVLYIEQEIGEEGVHSRYERIHEARGENERAAKNLILQPKDKGFKLFESGLSELVRAIQPHVIILDPLRKFHSFDESSSKEVLRMLNEITDLQRAADEGREAGTCSSILVHHMGKTSEYRDKRSAESIRGSALFVDDPDAIAAISKVPHKDYQIELDWTLRHAEEPPKMRIELDRKSFSFRRVG